MKILALSLLLCFSAYAQDDNKSLDQRLQYYVTQFNLKALEKPKNKNQALFALGEKLFHDKDLSGNRNISCATCHGVDSHGVDKLSFAIGEGAVGNTTSRTHQGGKVLKRNTPHIFNLKNDHSLELLFWDVRVRYSKANKVFSTPLEIFNGPNPKRKDITSVLTSGAAMQALFPILSRDEMRGRKGSNELANLEDEEEIFLALMKRIFQGQNKEVYENLFKKAYPDVPLKKRNIGHLLESIAHFEIHKFSATETPWDKYLAGDNSAMSESEKRGALVFIEVGMCIRCHNTDQLGGREVHNVGTPAIGFLREDRDLGVQEATGNPAHRFVFKTPTLRNVALTAPYMHNGSFHNLEEVIEHYDNVFSSIDNYQGYLQLNRIYQKNYPSPMLLTDAHDELNRNLSFKLPRHSNLMTPEEKKDLLNFLKKGLTDPFWK